MKKDKIKLRPFNPSDRKRLAELANNKKNLGQFTGCNAPSLF